MKKSGVIFLKYLWLFTGIAPIMLLSSCTSASPPAARAQSTSWQATLDHDLDLLGHRNWILVVDKAFPEQSSAGMKYLYVDQDLISTLEQVLDQVEASSHVKPVIYQDKELNYITEEQVEGIAAFRSEMDMVLAGREANTLLHEEVFQMLDESSSLFRVLVIKTKTALPYTSVFLQLDCAYWSTDQEEALRKTMQ